jgi:hypothetical protein
MSAQMQSEARVERVVENTIAYARVNDRTFSFSPSVTKGYRGESFIELGITEGSFVDLEWLPASGMVTSVSLIDEKSPRLPKARSAFQSDVPIRDGGPPQRLEREPHLELDADREPKGYAAVRRALPKATRKFGKLIDSSALLAGDLLLARELVPDRTSEVISTVQREGGYHAEDAKWTHGNVFGRRRKRRRSNIRQRFEGGCRSLD